MTTKGDSLTGYMIFVIIFMVLFLFGTGMFIYQNKKE